jgi:NAD+ synthase (glutamine-hydrolysing)
MRIALAQLNTIVGDLSGNEAKILAAYERAAAAEADLVLVPELAITGYPPRDLLLKKHFVAQNLAVLQRLAAATGKTALVVGYVGDHTAEPGRDLTNAIAMLQHGQIIATRTKTLLPTYDVFDEDRYFEPAKENAPVPFQSQSLGLTICEDVWNDEDFWPDRLYRHNPPMELIAAGADLLLNISASPWCLGKETTRFDMLRSLAVKAQRPVVYCNLVGGNDELVFDGGSLVFNSEGELLAQGKSFEEDFLIVELDARRPGIPARPAPSAFSVQRSAFDVSPTSGQGCPPYDAPHPASAIRHPASSSEELLFRALVLGLRDYLHKCGFKSAVLGLSGGIDSALVAVLAAEALGKENVRGLSLPSQFSSQGSLDDARILAANLGIRYDVIPIQSPFLAVSDQLKDVFAGLAEDTTEENIQARLRGVVLMALSNKFGSLLLTTGNKSELAVGYCTLYGDMCGGLAVISDVPKTMVYRLSNWINRDREIIPAASITKPPSAELRPNQTDQDSLPPYDVLDGILEEYVVRQKSLREILALGYEEHFVRKIVRLIDLTEYKRRQAAPGLKVTTKAFGVGRRMPIAQRFRESA